MAPRRVVLLVLPLVAVVLAYLSQREDWGGPPPDDLSPDGQATIEVC